jgi:hypothetical protein
MRNDLLLPLLLKGEIQRIYFLRCSRKTAFLLLALWAAFKSALPLESSRQPSESHMRQRRRRYIHVL